VDWFRPAILNPDAERWRLNLACGSILHSEELLWTGIMLGRSEVIANLNYLAVWSCKQSRSSTALV
jgi:hypothetical protein